MKIFEIIEARRNPDKNVKTDFEVEVKNFYESLPSSEKDKDWFVHFTSTPKLGIKPLNPITEGSVMPKGIYCYPLWQVYDYVTGKRSLHAFANQNFAYFLKVDSSKFLKNSIKDDQYHIPSEMSNLKTVVYNYVKNKYSNKLKKIEVDLKKIYTDSPKVLNFLENIVKKIAGIDIDTNDYYELNKASSIMTNILIRTGIHGIQNYGDAAPYEAIIMSPKYIKYKKLREIGQEYYSHASKHDRERYKPKNLDKINPDTGKKVLRYPNPFASYDMEVVKTLPQYRMSWKMYIKNAIKLAEKGKTVKDRAAAEKMLFSFYKLGGHKKDDEQGYFTDYIRAYKKKVLDKLNLAWTNPEYDAAYQRLMSKYNDDDFDDEIDDYDDFDDEIDDYDDFDDEIDDYDDFDDDR